MNNNGVYSLSSYGSELNVAEDFKWLWDSDESKIWRKKKSKKSKKRKKKKMKKMEKTLECLLMEQKRAKKKSKKKTKKQLQREFKYRLIEKSADVTMNMISDATRMYMQSKYSSSGSSK